MCDLWRGSIQGVARGRGGLVRVSGPRVDEAGLLSRVSRRHGVELMMSVSLLILGVYRHRHVVVVYICVCGQMNKECEARCRPALGSLNRSRSSGLEVGGGPLEEGEVRGRKQ